MDINQINAIERQFGLLQHNIANVNFKCSVQGTKKPIREIQIDDLRLYVLIEGNMITIALAGKKSEQEQDIAWLKSNF